MLSRNKKGQSILGVILAMAIFALMVSSIASTSVGNISALNQGNFGSRAETLALEAVESIRAIKDGAWNDLYSSSNISFADYSWSFYSTNIQTIGDYTRTVTFSDVCRNDTTHDIEDCATGTLDLQSKKVNVTVSWEVRPGLTNSVNKEFYLTNWDSREWIQSDWSSGPGQSILSDLAAFYSADDFVDYSTPGEIKIMEMAGGEGCIAKSWDFGTAGDYIYNATDIEVSGDTAHLTFEQSSNIENFGDSIIGSTDNYTNNSYYGSYYRNKLIHISGNIYAMVYNYGYYSYGGGYYGRMYVRTMEISPEGVILRSNISTNYIGYYTSTYGYRNLDVKSVGNNMFVVSAERFYYTQSSTRYLSLTTFTVSNDGSTITQKSYNASTDSQSYDPYLEEISPGYFAVIYRYSTTYGRIRTFSVNSTTGAISYIGVYDFDTTISGYPYIKKTTGNQFLISYRDSDGSLQLKSLNISSTGVIDTVNVQTYQLDSAAIYSVILNVSANIYAVAYSNGIGTAGWIQTVSVDPTTGVITEPANNSLQIESTSFANLDFRKITGSSYIVAYRGPDNDGFAKLVSINDNGSIGSVLDTYEFYNADVNFPSIVQLGNYYFGVMFNNGIAYTTSQRDYLYTFSAGYGLSYSSANPTITPTISYAPSGAGSFVGFDEVSTKTNGGEIYYQLSDNSGTDWKYWDGVSWATTTLSTDYNTATDVGLHISAFSTSTGPVLFKAYFEGNGTQNVSLDKITLDCKEEFGYDYNTKTEYTYDKWKVDFRDGMAGVKPVLTTSSVAWDFTTYSDYYYNSVYIDVSTGKARLIYLGPNDSFDYNYNTSSTYSYDLTKVEFLSGQARLKHVGPALGAVANTVTDFENLGGTPAFATDIIHVRDDIYVYVYNLDNYSNGYKTVYLVTKRISTNGSVISSNLSTLSFGVNSTLQTGSDDFSNLGIIKIVDGIIAVAYGSGWAAPVTTYNVDVNGLFSLISTQDVEPRFVQNYQWVQCSAQTMNIKKVENATDMYVLSYDCNSEGTDTLIVRTIPISGTGVVSAPNAKVVLAADEYYRSYDYKNTNVIYIGGDVYLLSYDNYSPYSWELSRSMFKTFKIDSSGILTNSGYNFALDDNLSTTIYNRNVSMVKLSDNYIAAVYQDKNRNGWLKTFNVNSGGGISLIQSLQYKTSSNGSYPDIVSLGSDNYAIVSNKINDYGTIDTFNISATGVINTTAIDSYIYENGDGDSGQIVNVGTGIYGLAYQNSAGGLALSTISISSAGDITNSLISTSVVGGGPIQRPIVTHIRDDIYLYTYADNGGSKVYLSTKRIASDGTVDSNVLSSATLSVYNTRYILTKISNGYFAIGYSAYISTYSVSDTGVISLVQTFTNTTSEISDLVKLEGSANVYAIVSNFYSSYVDTITISDTGVIGTRIDTFNYLSPNAGYTNYTKVHSNSRMIYVNDNIYAVSYDVKQDYPTYKSITEIITINIASNGIITQTNTVLDYVILDDKYGNVDGYIPDYGTTMVKVSNDYIAVSYTKTDGTTYLGTLNITSAGIMPNSFNYSLTYGSGTALKYPKLTSLVETFYALTYTLNSQMILDTYDISTLGVITTPKVDTLTYDNYGSGHSNLVRVNGNIFALAHKTSGNSAALTTLNIEATGVYSTDKPDVISSVQEDFSVDSWDGFTETSDKKGGEIYYQISDDAQTWYYWNNSSWVVATTSSESNIASVVNTNIGNFTTTTNSLAVRAFLSSDGSQKVALDNIEVPFTRTITGYASNLPTIFSKAAYSKIVPSLYSWRGFSHTVSTTSPGDVYYQISNDDGTTWYYWNGSSWQVATGNEDFNTVSEIDTNIEEFDASTKKIAFKAFMKSDTIQQVELDSVNVTFNIEPADQYTTNLWHFDETSGIIIDSIGSYSFSKNGSAAYGAAGKFNTSIGGTGYITTNAGLPTLSSNFTVEVWWNGDNYYSQNIIYSSSGYSLGTDYNGGIYFRLNSNPALTIQTSQGVLPNHQWTHIAVTYDGSYVRMYVNGIYRAGAAFTGTIANNSSNYYYIANCGNYYLCYIDEMRFSNIARWTGTSSFTIPNTAYAGRATYDTSNPSVTVVSSTSYIGSALGSIVETASKNGGEIYYQLSDDEGVNWKYWDGSSWGTAGSNNYNTASIMNEHLSTFATTTGKIAIKAFLSSNGTQNVRLDDIKFLYETATGAGGAGGSGAGSGGGFATSTYFISSAFDMGDASPVQYLDWDEDLTACTDCSIKIQVSTAPDNGGVPGTWTSWYGVTGADAYFVDYFGSIIPNYLNGRRWVRYRVELFGDGTSTPVFKEMRINYK